MKLYIVQTRSSISSDDQPKLRAIFTDEARARRCIRLFELQGEFYSVEPLQTVESDYPFSWPVMKLSGILGFRKMLEAGTVP